jgi:hypothetical protein
VNLLRSLRTGTRADYGSISTLEDYAGAMQAAMYDGGLLGGEQEFTTTYGQNKTDQVNHNFLGLAQGAYRSNGIVFACMLVRMMVFSTARFRFQRMRQGLPSETFGTPGLSVFERPWVGGTTQDLLARMIQDADLAGNAFLTVQGGEVVRMRPDWVDIVVEPRMLRRGGIDVQLGWRKIGYLYWEGGRQYEPDPVPLLPDEVCHWMPNPDPEAAFRGMSWLTPVIREVEADRLMNKHKRKYFENGATPNMVIKHDANANEEKVKRFAALLDEKHGGVDNAYRTLNLYPGADLTIASAAGVPPVIAGFSEGLQAATYSNYAQARRRLADGTIHPLWQNMAGSMEPLIPASGRPPGQDWRLWYDVSSVPFLREDAADAANITQTKATTIRAYTDGGFTPESAIAAVMAQDESLLVHTGLLSVQLQPPVTDVPDDPMDPNDPNEGAEGADTGANASDDQPPTNPAPTKTGTAS